MQISLNTILESSVVDQFRRRKLEAEEILLPDYDRPLWKEPAIARRKMSVTASYAFAKEIVRGLLP